MAQTFLSPLFVRFISSFLLFQYTAQSVTTGEGGGGGELTCRAMPEAHHWLGAAARAVCRGAGRVTVVAACTCTHTFTPLHSRLVQPGQRSESYTNHIRGKSGTKMSLTCKAYSHTWSKTTDKNLNVKVCFLISSVKKTTFLLAKAKELQNSTCKHNLFSCSHINAQEHAHTNRRHAQSSPRTRNLHKPHTQCSWTEQPEEEDLTLVLWCRYPDEGAGGGEVCLETIALGEHVKRRWDGTGAGRGHHHQRTEQTWKNNHRYQ